MTFSLDVPIEAAEKVLRDHQPMVITGHGSGDVLGWQCSQGDWETDQSSGDGSLWAGHLIDRLRRGRDGLAKPYVMATVVDDSPRDESGGAIPFPAKRGDKIRLYAGPWGTYSATEPGGIHWAPGRYDYDDPEEARR